MSKRTHVNETISPSPTPLPSGYTQLTYLEGTGTQYINTGVSNAGSLFRLVVDFAWTDQASWQAFGFGFSSNGPVIRFIVSTDTGLYMYAQTSGTWQSIVCAPFDTDYHIYAVENGSQKFDGVTVATNTFTGWSGLTFYLFAMHVGWYPNTPQDFCRCKLRGCQMWDNDSQIRNLVPALRTSDIKPGLYDTVNGVFYVNAGSGEFLYG